MKRFYKQTKTNFFNLALERCVKSDYIQGLCNTLPLTLLTIGSKFVINWLLVSRLYSGNQIIDFPVNLSVTVTLSYYSPGFYNFFQRLYGKEIDQFSKYLLDSVWMEGWSYLETWKNRILGGLGCFSVMVLFFVEVNSRDIQMFIIHTMIASAMVDWLNYQGNINQSEDWNKVKITETPAQVLSRSHHSYERLPTIDNISENLSIEIIDDYSLDHFSHNGFTRNNFSEEISNEEIGNEENQ